MAKVIEFLNIPTVPGGYHVRDERACEHNKLTFTREGVECRACGKQWRDFVGESERAFMRKRVSK